MKKKPKKPGRSTSAPSLKKQLHDVLSQVGWRMRWQLIGEVMGEFEQSDKERLIKSVVERFSKNLR